MIPISFLKLDRNLESNTYQYFTELNEKIEKRTLVHSISDIHFFFQELVFVIYNHHKRFNISFVYF